MVLTKFLSELRESGGVVLVGADMPTEDDVRQCSEAIGELDAMARLELAGAAPPLDIKAAKWATIMFYRCCQFLAFRDIPPSTIAQTLNNPFGRILRGPAAAVSPGLRQTRTGPVAGRPAGRRAQGNGAKLAVVVGGHEGYRPGGDRFIYRR